MGMLLVLWAGTSCSPPADAPSPRTDPTGSAPARVPAATPRTNRVTLAPRYPLINPVTPVQGRVTFVNEKLRFVIVDFAFQQMPRLEQRLGVFRRDERVGEVRISGPVNGSAVVADVMSGTAGLGDQVRAE